MNEHDSRWRYQHPELPAGRVGRATAWTLLAATVPLLLAVPLGQLATGRAAEPFSALGDGVAAARDAGSVVAANHALLEAIDRFERRLEDGSPLAAARPWIQWAQLGWGGVGNETVYAGAPAEAGDAPGWLIFRPGFDHLVGHPFLDPGVLERRRRGRDSWRPPLAADPRPAILDLHRQLAARGIALLLLPVPTKPAIHPTALGATPAAGVALRNPSLPPFLAAMEAAGIEVLDPSPLLRRMAAAGEDAYLHTDSHWRPEAVDTVAQALATQVERLVPSLPAADRDWTRTRLTRSGRGDLWQLLKLPSSRPRYPPETVEVMEVTSWDGLLWRPSSSAPVLLLGDSFTNVYSDPGLHWGAAAGIAEQLAYHLGRDVDRIARPDGSADQVRRDLARRSDRLRATKIVIYQFATRELSLGDWPLVAIP